MTKKFWTTHITMLRTLAILLGLLLLIGWTLGYLHHNKSGSNRQLDPNTWQWSPATSYDEAVPPVNGWQPVMEGQPIPVTVYWLRVPIPQTAWGDPYLKVLGVGSLKAYADGGQPLFSRILTAKVNKINIAFHWKLVPVTTPLPAFIDLLVRYKTPLPVMADIEIGNKSGLVVEMLYKDLDNIIVGALLLFSGIIAVGLYLSQRDKLYIYFAVLAFSGGLAAIVRNQLLQLIWDYPALAYYQNISLPIATFGFIGAMENVFPGVYGRTARLLRRIMLAVSAVTLIGAVLTPSLYESNLKIFTPLFVVVFIVASFVIGTAYRHRKDLESVWFVAGFSSLAVIMLIHMYRYVLVNEVPAWFGEQTAWVHRLPADLLIWGLFAFVVCLIRVIIYRYTAMNRQLTEFNRTLEQKIRTRTYELQERTEQLQGAHERLAASMRENAEAFAETMILEERHRITGSIHDKVGHTLSATIIQLEAAKRLIVKDQELAGEKLNISQDLVRKGLEDIRESVRLLREDAGHYDLNGAIGALIRDTEQSHDCFVEKQIGTLPDNLTLLQKRVVFQAVQEGLNSGLKQNKPVHFSLSVRSELAVIVMELTRYDAVFASSDFDFGFHAVAERAAQLGGSLTAIQGEQGAMLKLSLPIADSAHWVI